MSSTHLSLFAQEKQTDKQPSSPVNGKGISYGFVIDNSGSFRLMLENVIRFITAVANENTTNDEAFLVRFISPEKVTMEQDLTSSKAEIVDAAESMYIEGGQTAILDAIGFSSKHLAENARVGEGRARFLVLVSDGDDRSSTSKIEPVIQFLKDNKIKVIAVAVSDEKVQTKILDRLSRETGGKMLVLKRASELPGIALEVAATLRKP